MLKTQIKASQIGNLTDARYFAAWGVEWLGFCFDPGNENFLQVQAMNAIKAWIEGPKIIGEFGWQSTEDILTAVNLIDLDGIQLGMHVELSEVQKLKDLYIIQEIVVEKNAKWQDIQEMMASRAPYVNVFLLNFDKNGISWNEIHQSSFFQLTDLQQICKTYPIIISMDVNTQNLDAILEHLQPLGLNLRGGTEEKVGLKSFDELDDIFENLELLEA